MPKNPQTFHMVDKELFLFKFSKEKKTNEIMTNKNELMSVNVS